MSLADRDCVKCESPDSEKGSKGGGSEASAGKAGCALRTVRTDGLHETNCAPKAPSR